MKCAPTFHKQPTWLLVSHAMILAQMSTSVWRRSVAVVCSSLSTYGKMPTAAGEEEEKQQMGEEKPKREGISADMYSASGWGEGGLAALDRDGDKVVQQPRGR